MTALRILLIGTGGREHAIAWRCRHEGHDVLVSPGSAGMRDVARCVSVDLTDVAALRALAESERIDLCIVGPEQGLVDGLADRLREAGIPTVGPSKAAAALEGSKAHAKEFMARYGIPTAAYHTVETMAQMRAVMSSFALPPVVKASGLASGKGVVVAESFQEAEQATHDCLLGGRFGSAGAQVVLEERLLGEELSYFVLTDGVRVCVLPTAQDHKRLGEGDLGPNTGGMGAYCPAPLCTAELDARILSEIVEPTLKGLAAEGRPFQGFLFVGVMVGAQGDPKVIEYNVRLGDPETQALMWGLQEPLVPHLLAAARGKLKPARLGAAASAVIVLAAEGYPEEPIGGAAIAGLDEADGGDTDGTREPVTAVFHAGTRRLEDGSFVASGGRVLSVCARGETLSVALDRAYARLERIKMAGGQFRRDIGARARNAKSP